MTTATISTYYCNFCQAVKTMAITAFIGLIAFGESAGRARAAAELHRQGYTEEAKRLMTGNGDD